MSDSKYGIFRIQGTQIAIALESITAVIDYPEKVFPNTVGQLYGVGSFSFDEDLVSLYDISKVNLSNKVIKNSTTGSTVIILNHNGHKLALTVERSEFCAIFTQECINSQFKNNSQGVLTFSAAIMSKESFFPVLDVAVLFEKILHTEKTKKTEFLHDTKYESNDRYLKLQMGLSNVFVGQNQVLETIEQANIESSVLQDDFCMGRIHLNGQDLCVFNLRDLISNIKTRTEVKKFILVKSDMHTFALGVSEFEIVKNITSQNISDVSLAAEYRSEYLSAVFTDSRGKQNCVLDLERLSTNSYVVKAIESHAKIYQINSANYQTSLEMKKIENDESQLSKFLIFKQDAFFAANLESVVAIKDRSLLIPNENTSGSCIGIINYKNLEIPVHSLARISESTELVEENVILIFEQDAKCQALLVESIDSILKVSMKNISLMPLFLMQQMNQSKMKNFCIQAMNQVLDTDTSRCLFILDFAKISQALGPTNTSSKQEDDDFSFAS